MRAVSDLSRERSLLTLGGSLFGRGEVIGGLGLCGTGVESASVLATEYEFILARSLNSYRCISMNGSGILPLIRHGAFGNEAYGAKREDIGGELTNPKWWLPTQLRKLVFCMMDTTGYLLLPYRTPSDEPDNWLSLEIQLQAIGAFPLRKLEQISNCPGGEELGLVQAKKEEMEGETEPFKMLGFQMQ